MHPKFIAMIVLIFVVGALFTGIMEFGYFTSGDKALLDDLLIWQNVQITSVWGVIEAVGAVPGFFNALFQMLFMFVKFPFLSGDYGELYTWIILSPIFTIIIVGMIFMFIQVFQGFLNR